jgi:hypothetical protein
MTGSDTALDSKDSPMTTARSSAADNKRVQKIAEDAPGKDAADAPSDEEVVVVVEELPPGASTRTQRGRSARTEQDAGTMMLGMIAQSQKLVADGISRWVDMTGPLGARVGSMETFGGLFDTRRLTQEGFRFAEELLASQKEFALKVVDAMTPAKAA